MKRFITLLLFSIAIINVAISQSGTKVTSSLVPNSFNDNYSTHQAKFGKGGYRSVKNATERDAIFASRRDTGMLVYVASEDKIYILKGGIANTNWDELKLGGATSTDTVAFTKNNVAITEAGYTYTFRTTGTNTNYSVFINTYDNAGNVVSRFSKAINSVTVVPDRNCTLDLLIVLNSFSQGQGEETVIDTAKYATVYSVGDTAKQLRLKINTIPQSTWATDSSRYSSKSFALKAVNDTASLLRGSLNLKQNKVKQGYFIKLNLDTIYVDSADIVVRYAWKNINTELGQTLSYISNGTSYKIGATSTTGQLKIFNGTTWSNSGGSALYKSVHISGTGQYMWATLSGNGRPYLSSNYGSTFAQTTAQSSSRVTYLAIDTSARYVFTAAGGSGSGNLHISRDYGVTFTPVTPNKIHTGVALSWNGAYGFAVTSTDSYIRLCTNVNQVGLPVFNDINSNISGALFYDITCSSTGQYSFAACSNFTKIAISSNYGTSYSEINTPVIFKKILCDETGQNIIAIQPTNGYAYISHDYGLNWEQLTALGKDTWISLYYKNSKFYVANSSGIYKMILPTGKNLFLNKTDLSSGLLNANSKQVIIGSDIDNITFEPDGTFIRNGSATVWDDIDFPIIIRNTGTNIPTIATTQGNLTSPQWAVNDYAVCERKEIPHSAKLGATTYQWHIHLQTGGTNVDNRYVAFEIEWNWANKDAQFSTPATISSGDLLIPANTPANTHLVFNIGAAFGLTGQTLGAHIKPRLKRVASTGTAPTASPFCEMLQIHYESDMQGSRTITSK